MCIQSPILEILIHMGLVAVLWCSITPCRMLYYAAFLYTVVHRFKNFTELVAQGELFYVLTAVVSLIQQRVTSDWWEVPLTTRDG